MTIVSDFLGRLGSGTWGVGKTVTGMGHPLTAAYQMGSLSYPWTKDASNPGAAESRAAHGATVRNAYRDQFNEDRERLGIPLLSTGATPPRQQIPMQQAMQQGPMPNGSSADAPTQDPARPRVIIDGGQQMSPPSPMAQAMGVPMPQPRPQEAPQGQGDISWFLRNAYNQRDPNTGETIDPEMAQKYEAKNPFAGLFGQ